MNDNEGFGYTKITVEDGLGEPVVKKLKNDFALIVDGDRYVDGVQQYSNGTVQITIKKREE